MNNIQAWFGGYETPDIIRHHHISNQALTVRKYTGFKAKNLPLMGLMYLQTQTFFSLMWFCASQMGSSLPCLTAEYHVKSVLTNIQQEKCGSLRDLYKKSRIKNVNMLDIYLSMALKPKCLFWWCCRIPTRKRDPEHFFDFQTPWERIPWTSSSSQKCVWNSPSIDVMCDILEVKIYRIYLQKAPLECVVVWRSGEFPPSGCGNWLRVILNPPLQPKGWCPNVRRQNHNKTFRGRELCRTTPSANRIFLNARCIHIVCSFILQTTDAMEVPAVIKGVNVGLLITTEQNAEMTAQSKDMVDVAVILEEHIVLHELGDVR